MKFIKKFSSMAEYEAAELSYPATSLVSGTVIYDKELTPLYRTLTTATTCIGYDKYTLEEYQVSMDRGKTWTTTGTSATTLIEADSEDCGYVPPTPTFNSKWLATYDGGTTSSAECDASSAITQDEIRLYGSELISVEIGDCVTSIGDYAFNERSSLTSVTIPNSVTSIGDSAFGGCSFTSITIPSGVTSISESTFQDCSGLTSVTIPDGVTSIGGSAFYGCSGLTSINIPSGVTSIGDYAFSDCSSLTGITIPTLVTSIGDNTFGSCGSLTSITIPSGVTSIGNGAFGSCGSLTSITVEATTPPTLGIYVFYDTNDCPIYVPAASVNAYKSAWSDYASRIQAIA